MRRMSMSKLQSLSTKLATKAPWAATCNPGTQQGLSLPHRGWNFETQVDACHGNVHLQSFSQCLAKGKATLEVDQSRHLWVCETSWNTKETELSVSASEFPKNNSHWIQGKCRFQSCTSSQYHANISVESIPHHTTQNEFKIVQDKKQFTHFTDSQQKLETWKCDGWASADYKAFQEAGDKDTLSSHLESRDTKGLSLPHRRWNWHPGWCLSRKCSSSKLQLVPGQRESDIGSRSRLTSVRRHEIQRRRNSQFPPPSFQTTIPTGFKANVVFRAAFPANIMPISQ